MAPAPGPPDHDLFIRSTGTTTVGQGTISPEDIPNTLIFIVFGLIGAGFVCTAIWFFFRAKNGGFVFQEGDWEDYKSTVLRRKGPNGTTLSGASESTDLGGGSIVGRKQRARYEKRYKDVDMDSSIGTASEMNAIRFPKKQKPKSKVSSKNKKSKSKPQMEKQAMAHNDDDDAADVASLQPTEAIRAYRHEKPARVGGMNIDAEKALLLDKDNAATRRPTISKGLRAVQPSIYKSKKPEAEAERIKTEARRLQERGRAASKSHRIFSYENGDEDEEASIGLTASSNVTSEADREERRKRRERRSSQSPEKKVPGSWRGSDVGSEVSGATGTKAYHHPIPGLGGDDAEARRKARRERRG